MRRHACVCLCNSGTRCTIDCVRELPPRMKIALDLEKCGSHSDVERIEATLAKLREQDDAAWLAKFRAAEQDDAAWLALFAETIETVEALKQVAAGRLRDWRDPPAVHSKRRAAEIKREHAALAAELKRGGGPKPSEQAWEELAKRRGAASGYALRRRVQRNLSR